MFERLFDWEEAPNDVECLFIDIEARKADIPHAARLLSYVKQKCCDELLVELAIIDTLKSADLPADLLAAAEDLPELAYHLYAMEQIEELVNLYKKLLGKCDDAAQKPL